MMMNKMFKFLANEDGAVTVDWVVLTAAIVALGGIVVLTVSNGALDSSNGVGAHMSDMEIMEF